MSVLVIAEHHAGVLANSFPAVVNAASQLGNDVRVLVAGAECSDVAEQAAAISGVTHVLLAEDELYAQPVADTLEPLIRRVSAGMTYVLAAATSFGKDVLPRLAAKLDVQQISEITAVEGPDVFVRPIYAGNALATVRSTDRVKVITVRTSAFEPAPSGGKAEIERIDSEPVVSRTRLLGQQLTQSERPELTAARVIVSGGRGLQSRENFVILDSLADKLGAAVGASRAAVDAGYISNDYQIGQTGKIVAPDLYIAVGISGAIQHLAGMGSSKVIVAINNDSEAPIFDIADYGLVGDLFEVVPELEGAL